MKYLNKRNLEWVAWKLSRDVNHMISKHPFAKSITLHKLRRDSLSSESPTSPQNFGRDKDLATEAEYYVKPLDIILEVGWNENSHTKMRALLMFLARSRALASPSAGASPAFLKSPLLDYADMIYENTSKLNLSRLRRVYKQILRFALGS